MLNRYITILFFASITTFSLFAFMSFLISGQQAPKVDVGNLVDISVYSLPDEKPPVERTRKLPEPPPPPPMFKQTVMTTEAANAEVAAFNPAIPSISNSQNNNFTLSGPMDSDARPVIRVNPKYPINAMKNGIEGWVKLSFDINALGEVVNVKVIDSQPKRVFDSAAKKALRRWKYNPKKSDGKTVNQYGFSVQLDFNMEQKL